MNQSIETFLASKRVAVVGYSRNPRKFGTMAYGELKSRGFAVYAVHRLEKQIGDVECFPDLASLRGKIDAVFVSVPPGQAVPVIEEAASIGVRNIWLQQGAESEEADTAAAQLGVNLVAGKCILMYAPPVRSIHRIHRGLMRVFGKL